MKKINKQNLWQWKDSELLEQSNEYKLEVDDPFDRKASINRIKEFEAQRDHQAYVETDEGDVKPLAEVVAEKPKLEMLKVIFHSTGEQDIPYVFVGHNGTGFYLPKEVEIDVPVYLLKSCIKDAVEERAIPKTQLDGSIKWVSRKVQRYPYTIV